MGRRLKIQAEKFAKQSRIFGRTGSERIRIRALDTAGKHKQVFTWNLWDTYPRGRQSLVRTITQP